MKQSMKLVVMVGLLALAGGAVAVCADAWAGSKPDSAAPGKTPLNEAPKPREDEKKPQTIKEGPYKAEGTTSGGKLVYTAKALLVRKGDTYVMGWYIKDKLTYQGVALVDDDMLTASCIMEGRPCIVVYRMQKDGTLVGRWSMTPGVVDIEKLTYLGKAE